MNAQVSVVMGSISDWSTMKLTGEILDKLNVPYEKQVVSAHRMPTELMKFGQTVRERGIKSNYCGSWRGSPSSRNAGGQYDHSSHWGSNSNPYTWRNGFITLNRSNASWRSGCYHGDWSSGSPECGFDGMRNVGFK